jgi:hypothetical protein
MRYVDAEIVMKAVEVFNRRNFSTFTDEERAMILALENATVYEVESGEVVSSEQTGKPLGDESMPPQVRLEARLAAAVRLIDSFPSFSMWSLRFVDEQRRFLQELKDGRTKVCRAHRGETGI